MGKNTKTPPGAELVPSLVLEELVLHALQTPEGAAHWRGFLYARGLPRETQGKLTALGQFVPNPPPGEPDPPQAGAAGG